MSRTIAEREAMAREYKCDRCGAEAGAPCRSSNRHGPYGPALKSVHPERMALLPFELDWHRVKNNSRTYRAIDDRVTPHVVYEVGKGEVRYGYPWYVACWREGAENDAQRQLHLSTQATARRLASKHRCSDCHRWLMFGDLMPQAPGSVLFCCRDRESCESVVADREAAERDELLAIRSTDHDAITVSTDQYKMPVLHMSKGGSTSSTEMTPADLDRAIEVLKGWRDARPVFDVDLTVSSGGPEWVWPDER